MEITENLTFVDVEGQILDAAGFAIAFRQCLDLNHFHGQVLSIHIEIVVKILKKFPGTSKIKAVILMVSVLLA